MRTSLELDCGDKTIILEMLDDGTIISHGIDIIVELLLKHGANVHAMNDTALRWAALSGHREVLRVLKNWIKEHG